MKNVGWEHNSVLSGGNCERGECAPLLEARYRVLTGYGCPSINQPSSKESIFYSFYCMVALQDVHVSFFFLFFFTAGRRVAELEIYLFICKVRNIYIFSGYCIFSAYPP